MRMMEKLSEVAVRRSYINYTKRNKGWQNPEFFFFFVTLEDVLGMVG